MTELVYDIPSLVSWLNSPCVDKDSTDESDLCQEIVDSVRELQISQVEHVDGVRKYVSLARFGDDVREVWRRVNSVEYSSPMGWYVWVTSEDGWVLDRAPFQYRVPIDMIDEHTGKPKARPTLVIEGAPNGTDIVMRIKRKNNSPILFEVFHDQLYVEYDCVGFKDWKESGYQVEVDTCSYATNSGDRLAIRLTSEGYVWIGNHDLSTAIPVFDLRNLRPIFDPKHGLLPLQKDAAGNLLIHAR